MTNVKDQISALKYTSDLINLQERNISKIIEGKTPHGFPCEHPKVGSEIGENLQFLIARIKSLESDLNRSISEIEAVERDLTVSRRGYEFVVDNLLRHIEA